MRKSFFVCLAAMPLFAQQENEDNKAFSYEAEVKGRLASLSLIKQT